MSDRKWINNQEFEDAQVKWSWSNFRGQGGGYDEEGKRYFQMIVPADRVEELIADGWNIKENEAQEEGDPVEYLLKCQISYKFEDPRIYFVKTDGDVTRKPIRATEDDISEINRATVKSIDVILAPKPWTKNGRSGIGAYVEEMYVVINQSRFGAKYDTDYEPAGAHHSDDVSGHAPE